MFLGWHGTVAISNLKGDGHVSFDEILQRYASKAFKQPGSELVFDGTTAVAIVREASQAGVLPNWIEAYEAIQNETVWTTQDKSVADTFSLLKIPERWLGYRDLVSLWPEPEDGNINEVAAGLIEGITEAAKGAALVVFRFF